MYTITIDIPKNLVEKLSDPESIMSGMADNPQEAIAKMLGLGLMKAILEKNQDEFFIGADFFDPDSCPEEEKHVREHALVALTAMVASQEKCNLGGRH